MKKYRGIKYDYRPASYWKDETLHQAILKNVKGTRRRELISEALAKGRLHEIPDLLLKDSVSDRVRLAMGRFHPSLMGGEYLPDLEAGEVQIASVCLRSVTYDVISIRASRGTDGLIQYRIVDEYRNRFSMPFEESRVPLTLGELVELLEESNENGYYDGLILSYIISNAEETEREELANFTSVSSVFYPQLEKHCDRVIADWLRG